jgi:hypothetical protein
MSMKTWKQMLEQAQLNLEAAEREVATGRDEKAEVRVKIANGWVNLARELDKGPMNM